VTTRQNLAYCDVRPKIVPADQASVVEVRPNFDGGRFAAGQEFTISHVMTEDTRATPNKPIAWERTLAADGDGVLRIRAFFEGEQEHVLTGLSLRNSIDQGIPFQARVYSLAEDLFSRRPWKGDLHLHSNRSDGQEPPAYVAAACRRIGLDFMAVTDHHRHAPSLEAIAAFADVPHDLKIFPGEEAHPNAVHIINFGGRFCVDELLAKDPAPGEIDAIRRAMPPAPAGVDPAWAAQIRWAFDKVRQAGGLAIFCHPYWSFHNHYSLAEAYIDYIFDTQPFDAYELIGGFRPEEFEANQLQVAKYHDLRAQGRNVPIVGASDSHGCERGDLFGWYYTIAFAPSCELADLTGAIKDGFSVAVEATPGSPPRPHGPFRLVKYALFLLREVLPLHDAVCHEEGLWMHRFLAGRPDAAEELRRAAGRVAACYAKLWPA
jgi:hypothetical protein